MAPIIHVRGLRKVYRIGKEKVAALGGIDLDIEKGEFCCIVGASGSGKSTLLRVFSGIWPFARG
ncbi:MAG: ATP-binding cassette domain-containing protein, partial [Pygmaiobacter sp.]